MRITSSGLKTPRFFCLNVMDNNKVVVIGYGNLLRGDDGIGIIAVRQIREHLDVDTYEYHQLNIEVLPILSEYENIIFIDCSTEIGHGEVVCQEIEPDNKITLTMTHHLTPQQILQLLESLYNKNPKGYICKIGGRIFDFGSEISREVMDSTPRLINDCIRLINTQR